MPQDKSQVLESLSNIFRIEDLRYRVLITLGILAVYRLGAFSAVPGNNHQALEQIFQSQGGTLFGLFDLFAGGNLRRFSIFALGIMPYVTASIILELAAAGQERLNGFTCAVKLRDFRGPRSTALALPPPGRVKRLRSGRAQFLIGRGSG